jgi:hypothetical protein
MGHLSVAWFVEWEASMRYIAVIGIAAIASLPVLAMPVRAEIEHPWCA